MDDNKRGRRRAVLSDVLLLAGCACVSAGAFLLHPAAGCAALGAALIALAVLTDRGGGDGK